MSAYYNEIDSKAAAWLRELIARGLIADGEVDERSIEDVTPNDLKGFAQCHFFAGIGGWSLALKQAGWSDDRPVWTGSCPCQPFSAAGKGKGFADERHLWPSFFHLIGVCKPAIVFGEQVGGKLGRQWFDLVQDDLEGIGFACGKIEFPACSVGAPMLSQRLYWVGTSKSARPQGHTWNEVGGREPRRVEKTADGRDIHPSLFSGLGEASSEPSERNARAIRGPQGEVDCQRLEDGQGGDGYSDASDASRLGTTESQRGGEGLSDGRGRVGGSGTQQGAECERPSGTSGMAQTKHDGCDRPQGFEAEPHCHESDKRLSDRDCATGGMVGTECGAAPTDGFWRDVDWLGCRDGKWRPVEPSTFPLAHGVPARVVRVRGYGNAIVIPQAQAFIEAYLGIEGE